MIDRGMEMAELADQAIVIDDTYYDRVEYNQMTVFHMILYTFMEDMAEPGVSR